MMSEPASNATISVVSSGGGGLGFWSWPAMWWASPSSGDSTRPASSTHASRRTTWMRYRVLERFMITSSPSVVGICGTGGAIDRDAGLHLVGRVGDEDGGRDRGPVGREIDLCRQ